MTHITNKICYSLIFLGGVTAIFPFPAQALTPVTINPIGDEIDNKTITGQFEFSWDGATSGIYSVTGSSTWDGGSDNDFSLVRDIFAHYDQNLNNLIIAGENGSGKGGFFSFTFTSSGGLSTFNNTILGNVNSENNFPDNLFDLAYYCKEASSIGSTTCKNGQSSGNENYGVFGNIGITVSEVPSFVSPIALVPLLGLLAKARKRYSKSLMKL